MSKQRHINVDVTLWRLRNRDITLFRHYVSEEHEHPVVLPEATPACTLKTWILTFNPTL